MFGHLGFSAILAVAFILLSVGVLYLLPVCLICRKAGYPAWLGVAAAIPVANLLLMWFLAQAEWPVEDGTGVVPGNLPGAG